MPVYTTMWGPNEFTCTGNLIEWDRTDRLGEITVPTLITVGEFDEVHPSCAGRCNVGIRGSELEIFPAAAISCIWKTTSATETCLLNFLDRVDAAAWA